MPCLRRLCQSMTLMTMQTIEAATPAGSCHAGRVSRFLLLASVIVLGSVASVPAQEEATQPAAPPEVTTEIIDARRKEVEEAQDLEEAVKTNVLDVYRQAAEGLERAKGFLAKAAQNTEQAAKVDERLQAIKSQLDDLKASEEKKVPVSATLPDLEQMLTQEDTELTRLKKTQAEWEEEPKRRATRRKEIRGQLLSGPERLAEIARQQAAPPPSDEPPALTTARQAELMVRKQAAQAELATLQAELSKYDSEEAVDLVRQQRDLLAQQVARQGAYVTKLTEVVNRRRREEAAQAVERARMETAVSDPVLRAWAERNEELAEEVHELAPQIEAVDRSLKSTKDLHQIIVADFKKTKEKINAVRLSGPIGLMLRKLRATLPNSSDRRHNLQERREEIDSVHLEIFEYDDERTELAANLDGMVRKIVEQEASSRSEDELIELEKSATEILERRREYLDQLNRSLESYFDKLVELDGEEERLIDETDDFRAFINEHVLWIRSTKPLSVRELREDNGSALWLTDSQHWATTGELVWNDVLNNVVSFASALFLFGALFQLRLRFRRELRDIGTTVRRPTFAEFAPTMRATFLTLIISVFWPGLLLYASWRLTIAADGDEFTLAVGQGLLSTALVLAPLELLRQACRMHGLAEDHFGWSTRGVRLLARNLRWLFVVLLPLVFITETLNARRVELGHDAFERVCYITSQLALALFVYRILRPGEGLFREMITYNPGGWADRLKFVWFWGCVAVPITLAALAWSGYYYTALQLHGHVLSTVWLLVGLVLVRSFLLRWLSVHRRRLSIEQAKERRAAAQLQADSEGEGSSVPATSAASGQTDLAAVSSQIQRLLNAGLLTALFVGLWFAWADVLPALNVLDRWELGTNTYQVIENVSPPGEPAHFDSVTKIQRITAANAVLSVLIGFLTFIAARNVPGLLEMSLLRRLPMDGALRYAVTTLSSYLIVLAGLALGFGAIGVGWSKVQWLATALTFGLGFGLQEIFANFVSGIIILFEQPIRVGDVVTIENTTGVVSKIRIRATTIIDWDRKEFIVPNREFITGRLLNWTLSDSINRVVVNVGVAYGSDTRLARQLIEQIAYEHPVILDDPAPLITFEQFGDSSLNFVLRAYLPNMENRLKVIHDLHTRIDDEFRQAGIEIAFPQRDLHIRSLPDKLAAFQTSTNGVDSNGGPKSPKQAAVPEDAQH